MRVWERTAVFCAFSFLLLGKPEEESYRGEAESAVTYPKIPDSLTRN